MPQRLTITAALPYANGPIHVGHLAGCYLPADIFARYQRLKGEDVLFVCGSDENGIAITLRALNEGLSPQSIVARYHPMLRNALQGLGISFDIYSRTSLDIHTETARSFFTDLEAKGLLRQQTSEQYYDASYGLFLADRYIIGQCPHCGNPEAYGDQCERCGSSLSPNELINPLSTLSRKTPEYRQTTHWYFPLEEYQSWLEEWILQQHGNDWKSNVLGQCKSWLEQGLKARAITRDLNWGVPVPGHEEEGKVLYVWFDAPIGYISAAKDWSQKTGRDWRPYWQDADTRLIHFIGKDNIVFHCIIFPAILKAKGDYILPENVPANEFMNLEGRKISTSRKWAVWLHEYLEAFPNRRDELRYVLCANMPETKDSDFSWRDFQTRVNSELVAVLSNLAHRVHTLIANYFDGRVPAPLEAGAAERQLAEETAQVPARVGHALEQYRFREALQAFMNLARAGNKYLTEQEPWKKYQNQPEQAGHILYHALQVVANLSLIGEPFLPYSMGRLREGYQLQQSTWDDAGGMALLAPGTALPPAEMLFTRINNAAIEAQEQKLGRHVSETSGGAPAEEAKAEMLDYQDFARLHIVTGRILEAEKVPKTSKLLRLQVDIGTEIRQVVSGIARDYRPEEIIGRQVCLLKNLAPRKIRGLESQGMILMAESPEGRLYFVQPDNSELAPGSLVR
jgi:methionyl-tRNA synthetase